MSETLVQAILAAVFEAAIFVMAILIGAGENPDDATLLDVLQNRFPPANLEKSCAAPKGILVPGGAVTSFVAARVEGNPPTGIAERVSSAISLAQRTPGQSCCLVAGAR